MTIHVATVRGTLGMSLGTPIALTYIPANTGHVAGTLTSEQCAFVQNVTVALRTFLLSGETSSDDTWEIQITKRPSGSHGHQESTHPPSERKLQHTTGQRKQESSS